MILSPISGYLIGLRITIKIHARSNKLRLNMSPGWRGRGCFNPLAEFSFPPRVALWSDHYSANFVGVATKRGEFCWKTGRASQYTISRYPTFGAVRAVMPTPALSHQSLQRHPFVPFTNRPHVRNHLASTCSGERSPDALQEVGR